MKKLLIGIAIIFGLVRPAAGQVVSARIFQSITGPCLILSGSVAPNGVVSGNVCDLYLRSGGGAGTTIYTKESGTGTSGWTAVSGGGSFSEADAHTWSGLQKFQIDKFALLESSGTNHLLINEGTDLSMNRTLTITPGDSDRTITLSGNPTLADWFDQAVKVASGPTFAALTLTAALTVPNGGTGAAPGADDQLLVSDSTSAATWRLLTDCDDSGGNHLNYDTTANAFSCGTSGGSSGTMTQPTTLTIVSLRF